MCYYELKGSSYCYFFWRFSRVKEEEASWSTWKMEKGGALNWKLCMLCVCICVEMSCWRVWKWRKLKIVRQDTSVVGNYKIQLKMEEEMAFFLRVLIQKRILSLHFLQLNAIRTVAAWHVAATPLRWRRQEDAVAVGSGHAFGKCRQESGQNQKPMEHSECDDEKDCGHENRWRITRAEEQRKNAANRRHSCLNHWPRDGSEGVLQAFSWPFERDLFDFSISDLLPVSQLEMVRDVSNKVNRQSDRHQNRRHDNRVEVEGPQREESHNASSDRSDGDCCCDNTAWIWNENCTNHSHTD